MVEGQVQAENMQAGPGPLTRYWAGGRDTAAARGRAGTLHMPGDWDTEVARNDEVEVEAAKQNSSAVSWHRSTRSYYTPNSDG